MAVRGVAKNEGSSADEPFSYSLETIPVEKVPNPNGGKWPMKLYDPTELEQLAREVQNGTW